MFNHPMSRIKLRQLRQLVVVAEEGSIRAAAQRLSMGQPALSRSLRTIEDQLQVKLFERGPAGVVLTRYGEILCGYARIIETNLRFSAEEFENVHGGRGGRIRLGIGPYEGFTIAHRAIAKMFERRPDLEVVLIEGDYDVLAEKLLGGGIDLILGPAPIGDVAHGLQWETLAHTRPVLVVRRDHPLAERKTVDLQTLSVADWILSVEGSNARTRINEVFRRFGLEPPAGPINAYPSMTALELVKKLDVVALLPRKLVEKDRKAGLIRALPLATEEFHFPVRLTTRKHCQLSIACRGLIAEIKAVCEEIGNEL
ncbi:MAG: LysR family transcriptional regulator [Rhodobacteraceae bacterium]|nr:LysR family transcriptional regulator [Paracoccaceae bacterium]MCY4138899.1 LysR family transcriptional regulator [Paracoccaceae bacterium]